MSTEFPLNQHYADRVYAGVLGKMIGVYLGRPIEGWPYAAITERFGEITGYVHEALGVPLVVPDDDLTGTFTFLRALADYDYSPGLTPAQIAQTWLNYLIEGRTILWWGGLGLSTEHTAYLRLKDGILPPKSGSVALNGPLVAEQIGAQIFIDGWGLINPGNSVAAADFARRAACVSHDGAAIEGAQVIAAMVARAFTARGVGELFEAGRQVISADGIIRRLMDDICAWHASGLDWRVGFEQIQAHYGYDRYGGNCHIVPNHAIILHALLHGDGDFDRSLMIANTCGWDTDCNAGNVGCIMGVLVGLDGIADRWRAPVRDRLILPTADGGRTVSDAAQEATAIVTTARRLHGNCTDPTERGHRFHFGFPGSVQGFEGDLTWTDEGLIVRGDVSTPTMPPKAMWNLAGYQVVASPTLSPGQTVRAAVQTPSGCRIALLIRRYDVNDDLIEEHGPEVVLGAGSGTVLTWTIPNPNGGPIAEVGISVSGGEALLESLTWDGEPDLHCVARGPGVAWRAAWTNGCDDWMTWGSPFRLIQNRGIGLLMHGTREWRDITVRTTFIPNLAEEVGLAVRVQGMRRYYALLAGRDGKLRIVRELEGRTILAETSFEWEFGQPLEMSLAVHGDALVGRANGVSLQALDERLVSGAAALVIREGRVDADAVWITPTIRNEVVS